ncbi:hypothetical protein GCM10010289_79930 [Streptomyces violascens]|nr:hypothetical protein GCM10010289_79930 [Streptomyces violascens]
MVEDHDRANLVVIDRLQTMRHGEHGGQHVAEPDDAEGLSIGLKHLAMDTHLGQPPVLVMARLERPRREGQDLHLEDLGIAAEMEMHADTVTLIDRTGPDEVSVLVSKDRSGPAPRRLTVNW